jgi:hypothetical protein
MTFDPSKLKIDECGVGFNHSRMPPTPDETPKTSRSSTMQVEPQFDGIAPSKQQKPVLRQKKGGRAKGQELDGATAKLLQLKTGDSTLSRPSPLSGAQTPDDSPRSSTFMEAPALPENAPPLPVMPAQYRQLFEPPKEYAPPEPPPKELSGLEKEKAAFQQMRQEFEEFQALSLLKVKKQEAKYLRAKVEYLNERTELNQNRLDFNSTRIEMLEPLPQKDWAAVEQEIRQGKQEEFDRLAADDAAMDQKLREAHELEPKRASRTETVSGAPSETSPQDAEEKLHDEIKRRSKRESPAIGRDELFNSDYEVQRVSVIPAVPAVEEVSGKQRMKNWLAKKAPSLAKKMGWQPQAQKQVPGSGTFEHASPRSNANQIPLVEDLETFAKEQMMPPDVSAIARRGENPHIDWMVNSADTARQYLHNRIGETKAEAYGMARKRVMDGKYGATPHARESEARVWASAYFGRQLLQPAGPESTAAFKGLLHDRDLLMRRIGLMGLYRHYGDGPVKEDDPVFLAAKTLSPRVTREAFDEYRDEVRAAAR